jgi:hypothetical protein
MGIPADAVATETVDLIQAHKHGGSVTALAVVVEQTGSADAEFNVELDGEDLFAAEQSVAAANTPEEFIPEQNRDAHDDEAVELAVDVSSAAAGAGEELNVSVLWDDGR